MRLAKAPPRPRKTGRAAARAIGQSAFRERPQDLLLDRVARDEAADHHEPSLSDAAGAVRGAGFHHGSRWMTKSAAVRWRPVPPVWSSSTRRTRSGRHRAVQVSEAAAHERIAHEREAARELAQDETVSAQALKASKAANARCGKSIGRRAALVLRRDERMLATGCASRWFCGA